MLLPKSDSSGLDLQCELVFFRIPKIIRIVWSELNSVVQRRRLSWQAAVFCSLLVPISFIGCSQQPLESVRSTETTQNSVPDPAAFEMGIVLTDLPANQRCRMIGSIQQADLLELIWKVPGKVAFDVTIPCESDIDTGNLLTTIVFDPDGIAASCSSAKPVAELDGSGNLRLTVEHNVMAAFDTKGKCLLRIDHRENGHFNEIGSIVIPVRFSN